MKHLVLFVSLFFVVGRVAGRASAPLQEPSPDEEKRIAEEEANYVIADIIVEAPVQAERGLEVQEESQGNVSEPQPKVLYRGNQLWRTYLYNNSKNIEVIANLKDGNDITTWGGNMTILDILVRPDKLIKVETILEVENIKYEVVIEDLQQVIDTENPPVEEETEDRRGHRLTWKAYHRLEDINGYLDYLTITYPDLCTVQTIGNSVQGRPIKLLKISNGKAGNKAIWVDGGIHAREWISPATVTYIIDQFVSNYESEPGYIQNIDWYITPVLNPDGYEYSHTVDRLWRKNRARSGSGQCAGTDLNRNFGYRWGGHGSSTVPCTETYGGTGPFSEPETASVRRFITGTPANWKAYVSFHSYGQYILYPWGYDKVVPPDFKDLAMVGRKAAEAIKAIGGPSYTVGPAGNTLYPASGGSDDWAKGTIGMKYAFTIELRDSGRYGFVLPSSYIYPTAKEGLAAIRVIAEAAAKA